MRKVKLLWLTTCLAYHRICQRRASVSQLDRAERMACLDERRIALLQMGSV